MILIITESVDIPSQRVIAFLRKSAIAFRAVFIDKEDANIEINVDGDKILIDDINIESFTGVWLRRFNFHSYLFLDKEIDTANRQLLEYLSNEKKQLFEYVLNRIYAKVKNVIGHPDYIEMNKLQTLQEAKNVGFIIPQTQVIVEKKKLISNVSSLISKPIGECFSCSIQDTMFYTLTEKVNPVELNEKFFYSLFQENIPKKIESKVVYFNKKTYSVAFLSQMNEKTQIDSRNYDFNQELKIVPFEIPSDIKERLDNLFSKLHLNFGIVDFIITPNNDFVFLELNPVGQFNDIVEYGNYDIYNEIVTFLISNN